jgi:hypothetical protein
MTSKNDNKDKKGKEKKVTSLFRSFLYIILSALVVGMIIAVGLFVRTLTIQKTNDNSGLIFLEIERQGYELREVLLEKALQLSSLRNTPEPTFTVLIDKSGRMKVEKGPARLGRTANNIGLSYTANENTIQIAKIDGITFLTRIRSDIIEKNVRTFDLWPVSLESWTRKTLNSKGKILVYLTTRSGKLIFANSKVVKSSNMGGRPIVRTFVDSPLNKGQLEFSDEEYGNILSYFFTIPNTNIVYFSEMPKGPIYRQIDQMVLKFLAMLVILMLISLGLLEIPKARFQSGVEKLCIYMSEMSKGHFDVPYPDFTVKELAPVGLRIQSLQRSMKSFDAGVNKLLHQQNRKIDSVSKLDLESVFTKFFKHQTNPPRWVNAHSLRVPNPEFAGDWYWVGTPTGSDELLMIVVDPLTKGGSAITTISSIASIIATWEHTKEQDIKVLCSSINDILFTLEQSAAIQIAVSNKKAGIITFYNAGIPAPHLTVVKDNELVTRTLNMPSSPCGILKITKWNSKKIEIVPTLTVLMSTNGLYKSYSNDYSRALPKVISSLKKELTIAEPKINKKKLNALIGPHGQDKDDICLILSKVG